MIEWTPQPKLANILRNVCAIGWLLCLIAAAKFVGAPEGNEPGLEMLLFVGIFPFVFGAVILMKERMSGARAANWVPILFRGLPKGFVIFYQAFFLAVWITCVYLMMRQGLRKLEWPNFGVSAQSAFALIPSVFYLTSAGAFWSAAIESKAKHEAEVDIA